METKCQSQTVGMNQQPPLSLDRHCHPPPFPRSSAALPVAAAMSCPPRPLPWNTKPHLAALEVRPGPPGARQQHHMVIMSAACSPRLVVTVIRRQKGGVRRKMTEEGWWALLLDLQAGPEVHASRPHRFLFYSYAEVDSFINSDKKKNPLVRHT